MNRKGALPSMGSMISWTFELHRLGVGAGLGPQEARTDKYLRTAKQGSPKTRSAVKFLLVREIARLSCIADGVQQPQHVLKFLPLIPNPGTRLALEVIAFRAGKGDGSDVGSSRARLQESLKMCEESQLILQCMHPQQSMQPQSSSIPSSM